MKRLLKPKIVIFTCVHKAWYSVHNKSRDKPANPALDFSRSRIISIYLSSLRQSHQDRTNSLSSCLQHKRAPLGGDQGKESKAWSWKRRSSSCYPFPHHLNLPFASSLHLHWISPLYSPSYSLTVDPSQR